MSMKSLAKLINNATKIKTEPEEFLSMYNEAVKRGMRDRKPSPTYHPSSIGGCLRNLYFQLVQCELDPSSDKSPQLEEMGNSGTDRHDRIQTTISKMEKLGYPVEWVHIPTYLENFPELGTRVVAQHGMETLLANDIYNLSFKCDGLIRFKGKLYILEIKTEIEMKYISRFAPVDEHTFQANCYAMALGVQGILFLYENRNTCAKKPYILEASPIIMDQIRDKINVCDEHVSKKVVPPKQDSTSNCKYCSYKVECKKW